MRKLTLTFRCNYKNMCNVGVTCMNMINTVTVYLYIYIYIILVTLLHRYTNKTILYNITINALLYKRLNLFSQLEKIKCSYIYRHEWEKRCNCVTVLKKHIQYTVFQCYSLKKHNCNGVSIVNSRRICVTQQIT